MSSLIKETDNFFKEILEEAKGTLVKEASEEPQRELISEVAYDLLKVAYSLRESDNVTIDDMEEYLYERKHATS